MIQTNDVQLMSRTGVEFWWISVRSHNIAYCQQIKKTQLLKTSQCFSSKWNRNFEGFQCGRKILHIWISKELMHISTRFTHSVVDMSKLMRSDKRWWAMSDALITIVPERAPPSSDPRRRDHRRIIAMAAASFAIQRPKQVILIQVSENYARHRTTRGR
jgi:hypothetical protein